MISGFNDFLRNLRLNLYFVNDTRDVDSSETLQKIEVNTQLSFSYVLLLIASTIICTLGLLINSAPVVIGGMVISPLMWPLMKISAGVSFSRKFFIIQAFQLLILSIIISFISSASITFLSPLKVVTNEIFARTTPTLLDTFIAIIAGGIAAFSMIQRKISDSLAGVAIATSLMPPLCVSGIGLALGDLQIFTGAFFLLLTNVISIIFISVFIFAFVGVKRSPEQPILGKGLIFVIIILILTSLPLVYSLRNYSFKAAAYQESKKIISNELLKISPELTVQNISVKTDSYTDDTILIDADIISPETINFDYIQKAKIVSALERQFGKTINLNMRIQKTISIESESEIQDNNTKKQMSEFIQTQLAKYNNFLILDTIEILQQEEKWQILVVIRTDPNILLSEKERLQIQEGLQLLANKPVSLSINLIPLLSLKNDNDQETDEIRKDIAYLISEKIKNFTIISSSISKKINEDGKTYKCKINLEVPRNTRTSELNTIKEYLNEKYEADFQIELIITEIKIENL